MTARAAHRAFDSSQSRVRPVLAALEARHPDGNWVKELLRIAQPGLAEPLKATGRFVSLSPDPPLSGRERASRHRAGF
ncbi:MAG: hypothetical protein AB7I38_16730 [Dehalococcoidia bacterium]